ncbi:MFS transporter [Bacillus sp. HMF5848]|uniref:MFS transporter n=1 Tax=Bacillus sp. HMF5848 TaxID=2495421 RepID=UPI000F77654F|nr:MFS transporter [Bacillus sp. HMF5848]RSK27225.1 MFS transporter [Bacillus sp. HMF5848]
MTSVTADKHIEIPSQTLEHENKIILLWSLAVWLVVMNTTMFNVALPSVIDQLVLSSSSAAWIVSGYSIIFAIATLTYSRLSDFVPISKLLLSGLGLLGLASVLGYISNSFILLLVSRLLQAAGAGAVPGLAMVLAGKYIPLLRRGKAMSFISSAASLGFGLGPVVGGSITQFLGWNYLFVVTGIVLFLLPFFLKWLPIEPQKPITFDYRGALLVGISVTSLLLLLSTFWLWLCFVAVTSLVVLWRHIHKTQSPFLQPALLRSSQYRKIALMAHFVFIIHFSTLFIMPLMLATVFQKEPAYIGLIIFPGAILSALAAQLVGRLIDKWGNEPLIVFGHASITTSLLVFALLASLSPYFIMLSYMFMSLGFSALTSSISNEATRLLPSSMIGAGMGMLQLLQFFGGALGVTLTGLLLTIQEGLSKTTTFRNMFIILLILITCSLVTFIRYRVWNKRNEGKES